MLAWWGRRSEYRGEGIYTRRQQITGGGGVPSPSTLWAGHLPWGLLDAVRDACEDHAGGMEASVWIPA